MDQPDKVLAVCVAVRRQYERGRTVAVLAADPGQADELMDRLWTFSQQAFIPHERAESADGIEMDRVLITDDESALPPAQSLVLGRPCGPGVLERYETAVDFAEVYDEAAREASRARLEQCRKAGMKVVYVK